MRPGSKCSASSPQSAALPGSRNLKIRVSLRSSGTPGPITPSRLLRFKKSRAQLEAEYADAHDLELMRSLAQQHAESTMILRVGRTVVYALAKQLNKEWDQKALETASSPESLSMAADDFSDAMQNVRRAISTALRTARVEVESAA
jgi:hypothetical protein